MSAYFSRNNVLIIDFNGADESGVPRTLFKPRTVGDAFVILFCPWWLLLAVFSAFPQIDLAATPRSLEVRFPARWLKDHPLTSADLQQEVDYLRAVGFRLRVFSRARG